MQDQNSDLKTQAVRNDRRDRMTYLLEYGLIALMGTMFPAAPSSLTTGRELACPPYAPPEVI